MIELSLTVANKRIPPSSLREERHSTGKNSARCWDEGKYLVCSQDVQSRKLKYEGGFRKSSDKEKLIE